MPPDRHLAVDPCRLPGRPHVGFLKPERPLKPWSAPPDSVLLTRDAMPQARIVRPVDKRPASHRSRPLPSFIPPLVPPCACHRTVARGGPERREKRAYRASPGKALFRPSETLTLRLATDRPRSRSFENMISDAGVARQGWLAPAGARGQAAIACISGLTPKILIIRFIL